MSSTIKIFLEIAHLIFKHKLSYIPTINNNVLKTNSKLKSLSLSLSLSNDGSSFSHLCILVMEILQRWVNSFVEAMMILLTRFGFDRHGY